jgi:GNAT superfamily N-acetyltransferase
MAFALERLDAGARTMLIAHFLALPAADRYLRFCTATTPQIIAAYVDRIDFERDAVFGGHAAPDADAYTRAPAGVAHVALENDLAELGVSVLPAHREQGLGAELFERAVGHARSRGMRRLWMQYLAHNAPIMRMARKFGMAIVASGSHVSARLDLLTTRHARYT